MAILNEQELQLIIKALKNAGKQEHEAALSSEISFFEFLKKYHLEEPLKHIASHLITHTWDEIRDLIRDRKDDIL